MSCLAAARSIGRSASASRVASSASKIAGKSKPCSSPFSVPKTSVSRSSPLRSNLETSRCLGSMLPFHSATASSLLISMLSVSNPIYGWNVEGL